MIIPVFEVSRKGYHIFLENQNRPRFDVVVRPAQTALLLHQNGWRGNGGDPDLLEVAGEFPEGGRIALGGKAHDGSPLEYSSHGFHRLNVGLSPRLHDAPEVGVMDDLPSLTSAQLPESHPWLTPASFRATN
jgi:hypothetical protein